MGRGVQAENTGSAALAERQKLPPVRASKPGCLMEALKSHGHSQDFLNLLPCLVQGLEIDAEPGELSSLFLRMG